MKNKEVSTMDMFNTKRAPNEANLVDIIGRDLVTLYGKEASLAFVNSLDIAQIYGLNPLSQRIVISRWFINTLLVYRAFNNDKEVGEVLTYIINDGSVDDWHNLLYDVVIPFFKIKNVLNVK